MDIKTYTTYNRWANERLHEALKDLSDEQFEQNISSSFPSIKLTLLHLWDAQEIWIKRLQGESLTSLPSFSFKGGNSAAWEGLIASSMEWVEFANSLSEQDFDRLIAYKTLSGNDFEHSIAQITHHCMNHGTYHRGQLVTLARQLGIKELPSTDFIFYLRFSKDAA